MVQKTEGRKETPKKIELKQIIRSFNENIVMIKAATSLEAVMYHNLCTFFSGANFLSLSLNEQEKKGEQNQTMSNKIKFEKIKLSQD